MDLMFATASKFNGNLSNWDVSNVSTMTSMFSAARSFNGDVSNWDVSNVRSMSQMFAYTNNFNGDLSGWKVVRPVLGDWRSYKSLRVTNVKGIFKGKRNYTLPPWLPPGA